MSMMKRFAESVAEDMGKEDMGKEEIDEEELAEAQRRLDAMLGEMMDDPPIAVIEDHKVKFVYPEQP